ncbi:MAG TPA: fused MFS/spermidine synthase [Bacteroidota bacterium]|nr:fused MFS/spermidine synthase [Bacteroidota bacterium]
MENSDSARRLTAWGVVALGFSSITTQIVLLRECLNVVDGNELVIGIILANWMILTAAGSYLGQFLVSGNHPRSLLPPLFLLLGVIPMGTACLLRFLRDRVFVAGSMLSIVQIFSASFILLIPYCILAGASFTLLAHLLSEERRMDFSARAYSGESLGSVLGGLFWNFIFILFLSAFQTLFVIFLFNAFIAFFVSDQEGKSIWKSAAVSVVLVGGFIMILTNPDALTKEFLYPGQKILSSRDTPYGNLVVTSQGDQRNFFENGSLLSSTNDVALCEESVHYAMIQHPHPKQVLLICAGTPGAVAEILKYHVERVDLVEVDPWMISLMHEFTPGLDHPEVNIINEDPRVYVRNCGKHYDVVLMNVPDPTTVQNSRFYTVEFFRDIRTILSPDGLMSVNLLENFDYYGPRARSIASVVYNSLSSQFTDVALIPGSTKDYFLASSQPLRMDIATLVRQRGIPTTYVNAYYIDENALQERSRAVMCSLDRSAGINRDLSPLSCYYQMQYWLSYFESRPWFLFLLGVTAIILIIIRFDTIDVGMFVGGFASASLELLLIFAFQMTFGFIYKALGIIITIFMAGLAVGSQFRTRILAKSTLAEFSVLQFVITLYAILVPGIVLMLKAGIVSPGWTETIFFALMFMISVLIGMQFSLGASLRKGSAASVASRLYCIDLIGSAIGALLITTILIPLLGLLNSGFLTGALTFIGGTAARMKQRRVHTTANG